MTSISLPLLGRPSSHAAYHHAVDRSSTTPALLDELDLQGFADDVGSIRDVCKLQVLSIRITTSGTLLYIVQAVKPTSTPLQTVIPACTCVIIMLSLYDAM